MKRFKLVITIFIFGLVSFTQFKEKTGKELFIKNCSSCHTPTQSLTAPPFQKIREDYGLEWIVEFINNPNKLIKEKDAKALYGLYRFGLQLPFDNLSKEDIIKILDYVDSFSFDSSKYLYRKLSDTEKMHFVDSIQFEGKKDLEKPNQKEPLVDSIEQKTINSAYGSDTTFNAKKENGDNLNDVIF